MAGQDAHEQEVSRNISFFDGECEDVNTESERVHFLQAKVAQLGIEKQAAIDSTRPARQDYEVICNRMYEIKTAVQDWQCPVLTRLGTPKKFFILFVAVMIGLR